MQLFRRSSALSVCLLALAGVSFAQQAVNLKKRILLAPDDLQANFLQGFVRELVGPQQEAVDNYRKVIQLDPEHHEARLRLAPARCCLRDPRALGGHDRSG